MTENRGIPSSRSPLPADVRSASDTHVVKMSTAPKMVTRAAERLSDFYTGEGGSEEAARAALLAALDLTNAEAEAITLAVREKRDAHPVGDIWFDLDETLATVAALKASIAQGENTP